jgi:hypothetical protein
MVSGVARKRHGILMAKSTAGEKRGYASVEQFRGQSEPRASTTKWHPIKKSLGSARNGHGGDKGTMIAGVVSPILLQRWTCQKYKNAIA